MALSTFEIGNVRKWHLEGYVVYSVVFWVFHFFFSGKLCVVQVKHVQPSYLLKLRDGTRSIY